MEQFWMSEAARQHFAYEMFLLLQETDVIAASFKAVAWGSRTLLDYITSAAISLPNRLTTCVPFCRFPQKWCALRATNLISASCLSMFTMTAVHDTSLSSVILAMIPFSFMILKILLIQIKEPLVVTFSSISSLTACDFRLKGNISKPQKGKTHQTTTFKPDSCAYSLEKWICITVLTRPSLNLLHEQNDAAACYHHFLPLLPVKL